MALSDDSKINISIKKLAGRAQTSNDKDLANEGLPTGITMASNTIFGEQIPTDPDKSSLYAVSDGVVEYLRLSASFIPGTDTPNGRHAFSLQLPDDYVANSSNSRAGTYPFLNKQKVYITSGSLQLVPTSFSNNYEAKPYHSASNVQTQIPVLDARDWYLDYFNGILFQQDPPATGDSDQNPRYVDAFLYIGNFSDVISSGGKGDPNAEYLVLSATGSLSSERVFTTGIGLKSTDSGAGQAYILDIKDSIVATLSGSQFSGNVGITGSFGVTSCTSFGKGIEVNAERGSAAGSCGNDFIHFGSTPGKEIISAQASTNQVLILSGGAAESPNEFSYPDMAFFVSGAIGSKDTSVKGTAVFGGDVVISGSLHGGSPVKIAGGVVFNEEASPEADLRVRSNNNDHMFFIDSSNNRISIGTQGGSPQTLIHIKDSSPDMRIQRALNGQDSKITFAGAGGSVGSTITQLGGTNDIRLEVYNGSSLEEAMRVAGTFDGFGHRQIILLSGSGVAPSSMQPRGSVDLSFFVSGAIGSRGTQTPGTSVFGGDTFVSGTMYAEYGLSGSLTRLPDGSSYLIGGSGINISSASNGAVTIALGSSERVKFDRVLAQSIDSGNDVDVSSDFNSVSFDFNKIDVFINGQLMISGSQRDYLLNTSKTGSIHFNFDLLTDDIVTTIVNR